MLTIAAGALPWAGFSIGETIRAKAAFFKSGNGVVRNFRFISAF